jgi:hypothetical protein
MSMRLQLLLSAAVLACAAAAQTAIWTPPNYAGVPGNSNNDFPWNGGILSMRYQQIYSSQNFTLQSANFPVQISRIRFRAATTTGSWSGGNWSSVVLNMSTAATVYSAPSTTFASNHGANLTNVYTGPVTVLSGTGNGSGVPGPVYIDIPFTTPFSYDPAGGDLCLEIIINAAGWTGASTHCDAVQDPGPAGPARTRRVYRVGNFTSATGSIDGFDYGLVTEFLSGSYSYASASPFGMGCYGLLLSASARPLLGTSINLVTSAIPSGTLLGATVFSSVRHDPGIDLGSMGMPGCRQYVDLDVSRIFLVSSPNATVPQSIPNDPSFIGVQVHCQSATFSPGLDPLGVIASNGLTLRLDTL